jgi:hypothetical protein
MYDITLHIMLHLKNENKIKVVTWQRRRFEQLVMGSSMEDLPPLYCCTCSHLVSFGGNDYKPPTVRRVCVCGKTCLDLLVDSTISKAE